MTWPDCIENRPYVRPPRCAALEELARTVSQKETVPLRRFGHPFVYSSKQGHAHRETRSAGLEGGGQELLNLLERAREPIEIARAWFVTYDLEAVNILRALVQVTTNRLAASPSTTSWSDEFHAPNHGSDQYFATVHPKHRRG